METETSALAGERDAAGAPRESALPEGEGADRLHARGLCRFVAGHPLFEDHFPGAPRVPGTLIIEAMRREAEARFPGWRPVGVRRFRFRHFVEPGDYACLLELRPDPGTIRCVLLCGERRMAEGTFLVVPVRAERG